MKQKDNQNKLISDYGSTVTCGRDIFLNKTGFRPVSWRHHTFFHPICSNRQKVSPDVYMRIEIVEKVCYTLRKYSKECSRK